MKKHSHPNKQNNKQIVKKKENNLSENPTSSVDSDTDENKIVNNEKKSNMEDKSDVDIKENRFINDW